MGDLWRIFPKMFLYNYIHLDEGIWNIKIGIKYILNMSKYWVIAPTIGYMINPSLNCNKVFIEQVGNIVSVLFHKIQWILLNIV